MFWHRIKYVRQGLSVETNGLVRTGKPELRIQVNHSDLVAGAEAFLRFVVSYLAESGRTILPGETLRYGFWLVKFATVTEQLLEVWEYNPQATEFVSGGSLTVRYWVDQHTICQQNQAAFDPPEPDSLTAVSVGVLEGLPVRGLRYPWPDHMSGWVIVTDRYDGDVQSLTQHHTYHVTAARPDLAAYLALPPGFGFDPRREQQVWFDEIALREHLAEDTDEQSS